MVWAAVGYTMCPIWVIDSIHAEGRTDYPFGSECAPGYYTCASCCDQDADCSCDGHGGDAYEHDWRTPKCPEGYYECRDCCDRDADCGCDDHCDWGANADCSLAYDGDAKPAGWCPVGYHDCGHRDCCDWNDDCACDGAWRTGNDDEHCGVGPTGHDGALSDFECSVRKGVDDREGVCTTGRVPDDCNCGDWACGDCDCDCYGDGECLRSRRRTPARSSRGRPATAHSAPSARRIHGAGNGWLLQGNRSGRPRGLRDHAHLLARIDVLGQRCDGLVAIDWWDDGGSTTSTTASAWRTSVTTKATSGTTRRCRQDWRGVRRVLRGRDEDEDRTGCYNDGPTTRATTHDTFTNAGKCREVGSTTTSGPSLDPPRSAGPSARISTLRKNLVLRLDASNVDGMLLPGRRSRRRLRRARVPRGRRGVHARRARGLARLEVLRQRRTRVRVRRRRLLPAERVFDGRRGRRRPAVRPRGPEADGAEFSVGLNDASTNVAPMSTETCTATTFSPWTRYGGHFTRHGWKHSFPGHAARVDDGRDAATAHRRGLPDQRRSARPGLVDYASGERCCAGLKVIALGNVGSSGSWVVNGDGTMPHDAPHLVLGWGDFTTAACWDWFVGSEPNNLVLMDSAMALGCSATPGASARRSSAREASTPTATRGILPDTRSAAVQ